MSDGAKFFFVGVTLIGLLFAGAIVIGANQSNGAGGVGKWQTKLTQKFGSVFDQPVEMSDIETTSGSCRPGKEGTSGSLIIEKGGTCRLDIADSDRRVRNLEVSLGSGARRVGVTYVADPSSEGDPQPMDVDIELEPGSKTRSTKLSVSRDGGALVLRCLQSTQSSCTIELG